MIILILNSCAILPNPCTNQGYLFAYIQCISLYPTIHIPPNSISLTFAQQTHQLSTPSPQQDPSYFLRKNKSKMHNKTIKNKTILLLHPIPFILLIALFLLRIVLIIPKKLLAAFHSFPRFEILAERTWRGRKSGFSAQQSDFLRLIIVIST